MFKIRFRFLLILFCLFNFFTNSSDLEYLKYFSGQYDTNSDFYGLYNFVQNFFKKYHIQYPLNLEFSVKISKQGVDNQRYVISIPKSYLKGLPEKAYNDITAIIPNKYVKNKVNNLIVSHSVGSLIYAVDFFKNENKYKVYFDFPVASKQGITSFEWSALYSSNFLSKLKLGNSDGGTVKSGFIVRDYKPISFTSFRTYLSQILSTDQKKVFVTGLEKYLDLNKILVKEKGSKKSVCVKFKNGILVKEVKNQLKSLAKNYKDADKFSLFLDKISNLKISWIHLQKDEIAIYVRQKDWVYFI